MTLYLNQYILHILALISPSLTATLFQKGVHGESLNGYTIKTTTAQSLVKCSRLCVAHDDCYSFNFELEITGMAQCDLVYCVADQNNAALVSNTAMSYYRQVSGVQPPSCDACVQNPCQNGGTCTVTGPSPSDFMCTCLHWLAGETCDQPEPISTPNDYYYTHTPIDVTGKDFFTFDVKTCHDGHIQLSKTAGNLDVDTYEILLQGWQSSYKRSAIRDQRQGDLKVYHDGQVVYCDATVSFWISWTGGLIEFGKGHVYGIDVLLQWNDPSPHAVNAVQFTTGFGATGIWTVHV